MQKEIPRALFAGNEDYASVCDTDPLVKGVLFYMLTLTSFLTNKARGIKPILDEEQARRIQVLPP